MIRQLYRYILSLGLLLLILNYAYGQEPEYMAWSVSTVRPLAMGTAFTSIVDDIAAALYNPAAFSLYQNQKTFRATLFMNPVMTFSAYRYYSNDFRENITGSRIARGASLGIKALFISTYNFEAGLILNEHSLAHTFHDNDIFMLEPNRSWADGANTFVASLKIAKRAVIGVSGSYYIIPEETQFNHRLGFSYGILLKPHDRLNVGLSYIDLPKAAPEFRYLYERLADETMNIGISYYPSSSTILSLDIRNLTEESLENIREAHVGVEQYIFSIAALRAGIYRERLSGRFFYSTGIGLLDSNLFFNPENKFEHRQFTMNYAFIYKDEGSEKYSQSHFISLLIRF
ncbi:hypothetical protein JW960_25680 [candidate division KSB1 bacterium]|nr:hypothetical protein [candidate division KSB1 bacterium]